MKRLAFAVALAILVAPAAVAAKDAGPAKEPATKPAAMKVEPKSEPPASQPTKVEPKKGEVMEGKVELKGEDVKLTPSADDFDLWGAIQGIIKNFKEGKVWDGIALILMVLTFVFFKFKKDLPVKYAVWIAAGLGIATNIVSAIVGGVDWGPAVTAGLFQGAAAAGFWTMVGKHVFRSRLEKSKRAKARVLVDGEKASGEVES